MKIICALPYLFLALQANRYFPLSVISAVKIITLTLLVCGQDEQVSGMDQLYTGSGEDDTVQLSTTCSLTFTNTVWFCSDSNSGGPKRESTPVEALIEKNCYKCGGNDTNSNTHVHIHTCLLHKPCI